MTPSDDQRQSKKLLAHIRKLTTLFSVMVILAACNLTAPENIETPTIEVLITNTPTVPFSPTPSLTPSATTAPTQDTSNIVPVVIASPIGNSTSSAPTLPATPDATQGPFEHVVEDGQTMLSILPIYGYYDLSVGDEIVRINPNLSSIDILTVGDTILIPRQTATPIPEGIELTEAALGDNQSLGDGGIILAANTEFGCHTVQSGDDLVSIAEIYNTTLEVLSVNNRQLNWSGCEFNIPSGGNNCAPLLSIDACVNVPFPTATPIPTQTPSGNETATPTPTLSPPRSVSPVNNATFSAGRVSLYWVSAGILAPDETYLVEVVDRTANSEPWYRTTRANNILLDESLIPSSGSTHTMNWRIVVVRENTTTDSNTVEYVGGIGDWNVFYWQSR